MGSPRWIVLLAAALWPLTVAASEMPAAPSTALTAQTAAAVLPEARALVGIMADAGLPDGAGASLVLRPRRWLRAHGGGSYNMISAGFRGGVTLLPFGTGPSATVEAGHYFDGDANGLARTFAGQSFQSPLLQKVGYNFANAHLGLDLGDRRVTFYLHAGMSYVQAKVRNADAAVTPGGETAGTGSGTTEIAFKQDPVVRAWFPSAKLGVVVYLW
jgi:hypothetical protein